MSTRLPAPRDRAASSTDHRGEHDHVHEREPRYHRHRNQRMLWGIVGAAAGLLVASDSARADAPLPVLVATLLAAGLGVVAARWLTRALPLLGAGLGAFLTFLLMNMSRLMIELEAPATRARRPPSGDGSALTALAMVLASLAGGVLGFVLGLEAERSLRLKHLPRRKSLRSLAWLSLWVALLLVVINNLAAL